MIKKLSKRIVSIATLSILFIACVVGSVMTLFKGTAVAESVTLPYSVAAEDNVTLTSLDGASSMTNWSWNVEIKIADATKTSPGVDATYGHSFSFVDSNDGYLINGYRIFNAMQFETPIAVDEIKGLSFEVMLTNYNMGNSNDSVTPYGYFNDAEANKFLWGGTGIRLLGAENTGDKSILLDPYFTQGELTNWVISGSDLEALANSQGYITGFRIAGSFNTRGYKAPAYAPVLYIKSVKTLETVTVTYKAGETVLKTIEVAKGYEPAENLTGLRPGYTLNGWKTESGADYTDFTTPLTENLVLYGDFVKGSSALGYAQAENDTVVLTELAGKSDAYGSDPITAATKKNVAIAGDTATFDMGAWEYSISKALVFNVPVKAEDIGALTFNINFRYYYYNDLVGKNGQDYETENSDGSPIGYNGYNDHTFNGLNCNNTFINEDTGIHILGMENIGTSSVMLDPYFPMSTWSEWTISGADLEKLANADGYITGFRIASLMTFNRYSNLIGVSFQMKDVKAYAKTTVTYMDGEEPVKTSVLAYGKDTVENLVLQDHDGYEFIGWQKDGADFTDFTTPVTEDIVLTAKWNDTLHLVTYMVDGSPVSEERKAGTINLLAEQTMADKKFIGWTTDDTNLTNLYKAGSEYEITDAVTFYAVGIDISMIRGASARQMGEQNSKNGIRFQAEILASDIARLDSYFIAKGMIISPAQYWTEKEFTLANHDEDTTPINDVTIERDSWASGSTENYKRISGTLLKLHASNYSIVFGARAYMVFTDSNNNNIIVYTDYNPTDNARSMYQVAIAHIQDLPEEKDECLAYVDGVGDVNFDGAVVSKACSDATYTAEGAMQEGTVTLTFSSAVYSVIVNGVRLSSSASVELTINSVVYTASTVVIEGNTATFTVVAK